VEHVLIFSYAVFPFPAMLLAVSSIVLIIRGAD
jgi:hypothetical protein